MRSVDKTVARDQKLVRIETGCPLDDRLRFFHATLVAGIHHDCNKPFRRNDRGEALKRLYRCPWSRNNLLVTSRQVAKIEHNRADPVGMKIIDRLDRVFVTALNEPHPVLKARFEQSLRSLIDRLGLDVKAEYESVRTNQFGKKSRVVPVADSRVDDKITTANPGLEHQMAEFYRTRQSHVLVSWVDRIR